MGIMYVLLDNYLYCNKKVRRVYMEHWKLYNFI